MNRLCSSFIAKKQASIFICQLSSMWTCTSIVYMTVWNETHKDITRVMKKPDTLPGYMAAIWFLGIHPEVTKTPCPAFSMLLDFLSTWNPKSCFKMEFVGTFSFSAVWKSSKRFSRISMRLSSAPWSKSSHFFILRTVFLKKVKKNKFIDLLLVTFIYLKK